MWLLLPGKRIVLSPPTTRLWCNQERATAQLITRRRLSSAEDEASLDTHTATTTSGVVRNARLAAVIRQGIGALNQSATIIQRSGHTRKSLFAVVENQGKSARQMYEETHVLETAQACLERICYEDEQHPMMCSTGEPITLLSCKVNSNCSDVVIYWTLPYSVLIELKNIDHRKILERVMKERLENNRDLLTRIYAAMSYKRRLRVRLELATDYDVQRYLYFMENDSPNPVDSDLEEDEDGSEAQEDEDGSEADDDERIAEIYESTSQESISSKE